MSTIPLEPPVETPNRVETARQMTEQVRAIVTALPGFVFITREEKQRLIVSASLPDRFVEVAATAMEQVPALASAAKMSAAEFRSAIAGAQAYLGLAEELERLARGVRDTVRVDKGAVGTEALRVYSVARHLDRPRDTESTVTSLGQMQRLLNRGRLRTRLALMPPDEPPAGGAQ